MTATQQRKKDAQTWAKAIENLATNDPNKRMEFAKKLGSLLRAWKGVEETNTDLWETVLGYGVDGVSTSALSAITGITQPGISQRLTAWHKVGLLTSRKEGVFKMYAVNLDTLFHLTGFEKEMQERANLDIPAIIEKCGALSLPLNAVIYSRLMDAEMNVSQLMGTLNTLDQSKVSGALARLRETNLVTREAQGNSRLYRSHLGMLFCFEVAMRHLVKTKVLSFEKDFAN